MAVTNFMEIGVDENMQEIHMVLKIMTGQQSMIGQMYNFQGQSNKVWIIDILITKATI